MDYVPSHGNTAQLNDRDNISGCRAFDGEDQGMCSTFICNYKCNSFNKALSHTSKSVAKETLKVAVIFQIWF